MWGKPARCIKSEQNIWNMVTKKLWLNLHIWHPIEWCQYLEPSSFPPHDRATTSSSSSSCRDETDTRLKHAAILIWIILLVLGVTNWWWVIVQLYQNIFLCLFQAVCSASLIFDVYSVWLPKNSSLRWCHLFPVYQSAADSQIKFVMKSKYFLKYVN